MKTTTKNLLTLFLLTNTLFLSAQITEAELNMDGIVFPRYSTEERDVLINAPIQGQCIYNTSINAVECYDGNEWNTDSSGLYCWDTNENGIGDVEEDINNDGAFNALDCVGAPGPVGPVGPVGATGATGATGQ